MNILSILQLFVSSGLAMGFVLLIYRAGRLVESVNGLDHRLTGVEHTIKDMGKELKDVQTKVTVLWEQRKIS